MATITLPNVAANPPQALARGINWSINRVSISVSGTPAGGDLLRIGKIPHGAIPVLSVWYPATPYGVSKTAFGTSASPAMFFSTASWTIAAVGNKALGTPQQLSLTDGAVVRYDHIVCQLDAAGNFTSVGFMGELHVAYAMPSITR